MSKHFPRLPVGYGRSRHGVIHVDPNSRLTPTPARMDLGLIRRPDTG